MGLPELEAIATPLVQFNSASEVDFRIAWGFSFAALTPIYVVDLPESDISGSVWVVVDGMSVSSTLMWDDALAALFVPRVLITPVRDVLHTFIGSTETGGAFSTGAVASAWVRVGEEEDCYEQGDE